MMRYQLLPFQQFHKQFHDQEENNYYKLVKRTSEVLPYKYEPENYEFSPKSQYPALFWKLSPSIRSQVGGPDGFYFGDLKSFFREADRRYY